MVERKRIGRNIGRIELRAVQDKVQSLLDAGYDRKKIHDRLMEEGCVTMSYPTFCYQLKQLVGSVSAAASPGRNQRAKPTVPPKVDPT